MKIFKYFLGVWVMIAFGCGIKSGLVGGNDQETQSQVIKRLMDDWHKAAADADLNAYFYKMTDDAVYLGTDIGERWTKQQFYEFCKPYFDKGKAWDFTPSKRTIYFSEDMKTAWFEESLETWMGPCRGSGVLLYKNREWKIAHYNLAVAVANDVIKLYIELIRKE
jgi:hypothetical protein